MESLKWSFENEFGVEIILRAYTPIYMCAHTAVPIVNKRLASRQAHGTSKPAICAKYTKYLLIYGSQQLPDLSKKYM
jgi:hypothetical protein